MSWQIKNFGCSVIKDFIERDKLILNDFDILQELSTYVSGGTGKITWGASEGHYDDLIACLVLFGWLTSQPYYQDYSNTNVRQLLYEEKLKKAEEDVSLFGFIDDGITDYYNNPQKDVWDLSVDKTPKEQARERRQEYKNIKFDW